MSKDELEEKVKQYFKLQTEIAELTSDIGAIKHEIKSYLRSSGLSELTGRGWKAALNESMQYKLDHKSLKKDHADLYRQYTRPNIVSRFTLNRVKSR